MPFSPAPMFLETTEIRVWCKITMMNIIVRWGHNSIRSSHLLSSQKRMSNKRSMNCKRRYKMISLGFLIVWKSTASEEGRRGRGRQQSHFLPNTCYDRMLDNLPHTINSCVSLAQKTECINGKVSSHSVPYVGAAAVGSCWYRKYRILRTIRRFGL